MATTRDEIYAAASIDPLSLKMAEAFLITTVAPMVRGFQEQAKLPPGTLAQAALIQAIKIMMTRDGCDEDEVCEIVASAIAESKAEIHQAAVDYFAKHPDQAFAPAH